MITLISFAAQLNICATATGTEVDSAIAVISDTYASGMLSLMFVNVFRTAK
jgi:hypothetical protein